MSSGDSISIMAQICGPKLIALRGTLIIKRILGWEFVANGVAGYVNITNPTQPTYDE
jgi:hypothetical protein